MRRWRYVRAECTPGLQRREAARARFDALYGPCTDVPGGQCPVHGYHESDAPGDSSWSRTDTLTAAVAALLMAGVITGLVFAMHAWGNWVLWLGVPAGLMTNRFAFWLGPKVLPDPDGDR